MMRKVEWLASSRVVGGSSLKRHALSVVNAVVGLLLPPLAVDDLVDRHTRAGKARWGRRQGEMG